MIRLSRQDLQFWEYCQRDSIFYIRLKLSLDPSFDVLPMSASTPTTTIIMIDGFINRELTWWAVAVRDAVAGGPASMARAAHYYRRVASCVSIRVIDVARG